MERSPNSRHRNGQAKHYTTQHYASDQEGVKDILKGFLKRCLNTPQTFLHVVITLSLFIWALFTAYWFVAVGIWAVITCIAHPKAKEIIINVLVWVSKAAGKQ